MFKEQMMFFLIIIHVFGVFKKKITRSRDQDPGTNQHLKAINC